MKEAGNGDRKVKKGEKKKGEKKGRKEETITHKHTAGCISMWTSIHMR